MAQTNNINVNENNENNVNNNDTDNDKNKNNSKDFCNYINNKISYFVPKSLKLTVMEDVIFIISWISLMAGTIAISYLLIMGLGFLGIVITMSHNHDIHTGCYYNDTRIDSTQFCQNVLNNDRYIVLSCSTWDNGSIWGGCFLIGMLVTFICIIIAILLLGLYINLNEKIFTNDEDSDNEECKKNQQEISMDTMSTLSTSTLSTSTQSVSSTSSSSASSNKNSKAKKKNESIVELDSIDLNSSNSDHNVDLERNKSSDSSSLFNSDDSLETIETLEGNENKMADKNIIDDDTIINLDSESINH